MYGADGGTKISLRSLGIQRTLLINGRRVVPTGLGASSAVDLNSIPTSAVERIEVLKDGASAIYGSDAVAGVVNLITRKSFNGTELAAQYGVSGHGDAQTFDSSVTSGWSGELGNFLFSAGYFDQKDSWLRDRSWSNTALTFDYSPILQGHPGVAIPGGSGRTPQGTVALPNNNGAEPAACAANPVCHGLVVSDPNWTNDNFIRCAPGDTAATCATTGFRLFTDNDRYNFAAENYLTIPSTRIQAYSAGDTHIGPARGYFEASYVNRKSQNAAPMPLNPGDYTLDGVNLIEVSANSLYNLLRRVADLCRPATAEFGHRTYNAGTLDVPRGGGRGRNHARGARAAPRLVLGRVVQLRAHRRQLHHGRSDPQLADRRCGRTEHDRRRGPALRAEATIRRR